MIVFNFSPKRTNQRTDRLIYTYINFCKVHIYTSVWIIDSFMNLSTQSIDVSNPHLILVTYFISFHDLCVITWTIFKKLQNVSTVFNNH